MQRRTLLKGTLAAAGLAATSTLATGCSEVLNPGGGGKTLTVYSNSLSDGRDEWLKEQATKAGYTLQTVALGGADVMNRLLAEKSNPVADFVFGLNNVYWEKVKATGLLESFTPSWGDKVDADKVDKDKLFWPIVHEPIMLVYDLAAFPGGQGAPKDWPDLWKTPALKGRYEVPSGLGGATSQMVLSGIMTRFLDKDGKFGVSEEGWKNLGEYFANGSPAVQGTDLYARMKAGDIVAGQMWLAGKATREKQYGVQSDAAKPAVGVPMVVQSLGIVKGSKKLELAKEFANWFGSAEIQGAWSKEFFTAPTNKDAEALGDKDAIKVTNDFLPQDIDWTFVAENLDKWVEEATLKYIK